jgi:hypothetical protein
MEDCQKRNNAEGPASLLPLRFQPFSHGTPISFLLLSLFIYLFFFFP